jgi:glycosyltransferase involved in cell wall biosynthesis
MAGPIQMNKLMTQPDLWKKKFEELRICVIIPTYNNAPELGGVISETALFTDQIIVVNDGSTDETEAILRSFPFIKLISYTKNIGKGWAIRKGFRLARELGYEFAITIDSDGQHSAKDLPAFVQKIELTPEAIIIGARNMDQLSVPKKSSFGHRFSNFWFHVETGIKAPDTQSGFRSYPLAPLKRIHFFTRKYEFEIEVLVRAAWKKIKIESIPISVYYAPKEERISHFRPFLDFTRISILNTVLVFVSFLFIKPRDFFLSIFQKKKWKSVVNDFLFNSFQSDGIKAFSVALGAFIGILPIWGFQLVLAIFLAILLKLNKPLVIIAANISIPPMIPLIIFLSYKVGAFWMHGNTVDLKLSGAITRETAKLNLQQYIFGSVTLAIVTGAGLGLFAYMLLKFFGRKTSSAN